MDAETDAAEDLELRQARGRARFNYAAGCLLASREKGLLPHERAAYLSSWRRAREEAGEPGGPALLCTISHSAWIASTEHVFPSDGSHTVPPSASNGRPRRGLPRGGDSAAGVREGPMQQLPIMRGLEGGRGERDENTGEALLNDIFDLISKRLPRLPLTDPARPALAALSPMLAQALGRPLVAEVPSAQQPA